MQLSTRGRYAVMALLDLVELQQELNRAVTLAEISEKQRISLSYLEQLFSKLRKSGVVESTRGPGGGYTLAKSPAQTYLSEAIGAVDENTDMTRCGITDPSAAVHGTGCVAGKKCNTHELWIALGYHVEAFFANITLQMVLDGDVKAGFSILPEWHQTPAFEIQVKN